ncbi:MAG: cobalamin-binding protein [Candidatus Rokubacteria bacterium]|nr:cobalamin-binding protein [Candidatus Rokubacteria bacterium]
MRIVALLPSATEIVAALGLANQLVGISHSCDYPTEVLGKPVLTRACLEPKSLESPEIDALIAERVREGRSVYELDAAGLAAADPDLILTQELCDVCAVGYRDVTLAIGELGRKPAVLSLDPCFLGDVLRDIQRVAVAAGVAERAKPLVSDLRRRIETVAERAKEAETRPRVACLEWLDPLYTAGHWVPEMVELAGGRDVLAARGEPARRIPWEQVLAAKPDVLVLMPCGFDIPRTLKELHRVTGRPSWGELPGVKAGRAYAVNGHAYYNRFGPRVVDGLEFLAHLIHPDMFPNVPPADAVIPLPAT